MRAVCDACAADICVGGSEYYMVWKLFVQKNVVDLV